MPVNNDGWVDVPQNATGQGWVDVPAPGTDSGWVDVEGASPEPPGLIERAGDFLQEQVVDPLAQYAQSSEPVLPKIGEVAKKTGQGFVEGLQLDRPLGAAEEEVEKVPVIEAGPFTFTELRDVARGLGIAQDVVHRALGSLFSGTASGVEEALKQAGASDTQAGQLRRDFETFLLGRAGEVGGQVRGVPGRRGPLREQVQQEQISRFTEQARDTLARRRAEGEQVLRDPFDVTKRLPPPEGTVSRAPEAPRPSPFPNAATDDLIRGLDVDFAAAPTAPPVPSRPAATRPGGPVSVQGYQEGVQSIGAAARQKFGGVFNSLEVDTAFKRRIDALVSATGKERSAVLSDVMAAAKARGDRPEPDRKEVLSTDWDEYLATHPDVPRSTADAAISAGVGPEEFFTQVDRAAQSAKKAGQRVGDAARLERIRRAASDRGLDLNKPEDVAKLRASFGKELRAELDKLTAQRAKLSDREKYEIAKADQERRQREQQEKAVKPKPKFSVIEGGKKVDEPDPTKIPMMPPEDGGVPTITPDETRPTIALPEQLGPIPTVEEELFALVPKDIASAEAVTFGSPAQLEAGLAGRGEQNVRIIRATRDQLAGEDVTAVLSDLPTMSNQSHLVRGGTSKGRDHARAAIDAYKLYKQNLVAGTPSGQAQARHFLTQALENYRAAVRNGVRVTPGPGGAVVLNSRNLEKFSEVAIEKAPATTRTKATHYFIPALERGGLSLFSRLSPRVARDPAAAIDIRQLSKMESVTALPRVVADRVAKDINAWFAAEDRPIAELREILQRGGTLFTKGSPDWLVLQTARLIDTTTLPESALMGYRGRRFVEVLEAGVRFRVDPDTNDFIVPHKELTAAAIPGVSFPGPDSALSRMFTPGWRAEVPQLEKGSARYENTYGVTVLPEHKRILRGLAKVANAVMRDIGMKVEVVLEPVSSAVMAGKYGGNARTLGMLDIAKRREGKFTIALNVEKLFDDIGNVDGLGTVSAFAHEFGHTILFWLWDRVPYALQQMMWNLAERMRLTFRTASIRDAFARGHSAPMFVTFSKGRGARHPIHVDTQFIDYYSSLTEIFAREVERVGVSSLALAGKGPRSFLTKLRNDLKTMYDAVHKYDPNFFEPSAAIRDLLRYVKENKGQSAGFGRALAENMQQKMDRSMQPSGKLAVPGVRHPPSGNTLNGRLHVQGIFGGNEPPTFRRGFNIAADAADWLSWIMKKSLAIRELAHQNRQRLPELSHLADVEQQFNAFINRQHAKHERLLKRGFRLGPTRGDNLTRFTFHMTQMEYRTAIEKQRNVRRHPTQEEFLSAARRFGMDREMLEIYADMRKSFIDYLNTSKVAWTNAARRTFRGEELQTKLAEIDAYVQQQLNSPYFPMTRFGDYFIVVKDIDGKTVYAENFVTSRERDAAKPSLVRQYPSSSGFTVSADIKLDESLRPFAGVPARTLEKIRDRLNLGAHPELEKQFDALLFELGPERSHRKHFLEREGIPGFSSDMWRVYSDYFMHGDRALARMLYEHQMQQAINSMYRAKERFLNDREKDRISRLADFAQGQVNDLMSPAMDWARTKGAMYFWTLAFSPATSLIQLSQLVFSWGHLTKVYGTFIGTKEVNKALGRSSKNMRSVFTNRAFDIDPVKRRAREQAYEEGVLRDGLAAEMANVASGSILSRYNHHSRIGRYLANLNYWGGYFISATDNFGRHVTFDAAYDLATRDPRWVDKVLDDFPDYRMWYNRTLANQNLGWTEEQAKRYIAAVHAVNTTFFETGRWAKPPLLKGGSGLIFFLHTFTRAMMHFLATAPGGRRVLFVWWLLAGTAGLPFAEDLDNVIKQVAGLTMGKDFSPLRELRKMLVDTFGEDSKVPGVVMNGLSSQSMGVTLLTDPMGIPFPHFDWSASMSLGRIIPGLADVDLRRGLRPEQLTGDIGFSGAGVPGSLALNFMRFATSSLPFDDPKRWELVLPRRLRNLVKANRIAYEGSDRYKSGASIPGTEFDWKDPGDALDLLMLGLGDFQPARLRRAQTVVGQQIEAQEFWTAMAKSYRGRYYQALDSRDQVDIREALDGIKEYNKKARDAGYPTLQLAADALRTGYRQHIRSTTKLEQGLPQGRKFTPLFKDVERVYGSGATVIDQKKVK